MDQTAKDGASAPASVRDKTIVLVGLMGAGKTSVGKRLAAALDLPFIDGDDEVEKAAGCSITDIFARFGEEYFREGERRVMQRLLTDPPHVLATGGGAFMHPSTRASVKEKAVSVWLKTDVETLVKRVARKNTRPLLAGKDPVKVLTQLAAIREPLYAEADIVIESGDRPHAATVDAIIEGIRSHRAKDAA